MDDKLRLARIKAIVKKGGILVLEKMTVNTKKHDEMVDVTSDVQQFVQNQKLENGIVIVYCPHTTAGITVNENADPDVKHDMLMKLDEVYPWEHPKYKHAEGNSASHLKASTVGTQQTLIVENGNIVLGTWQGIYFCEFDGPRRRSIYMKAMKESSA